MKVLFNFALLALWSALQETATSSRVADDFCLEKQQAGQAPGTVFSLYDTCQMCACDGALRKFCTSDPACKRRKQEEYDAIHRRPCYRGGSRYAYGSQVQQDCNICTCNNAAWICTTEECGYSEDGEEEEDKKEQDRTEVSNETASSQVAANCEDEDQRCSNWVTKKRESLCNTNKYVQKKCRSSCDNCPEPKEDKKSVDEEVEVCEDLNTHCSAWSKRENLCKTHKYMRVKCKVSCDLCDKKEGEKQNEVTEEDTEEEEEEGDEEETVQDETVQDEEETREKTAEELEEERKQQEIDAWRARLIAEGQLIDTKKTPIGCIFNCGGTVYPWGSALQDSHCGVCTCKRRSRLEYYFRCTNRECETNPTCT